MAGRRLAVSCELFSFCVTQPMPRAAPLSFTDDQLLRQLIAGSDVRLSHGERARLVELYRRIAPLFVRPEPRRQAVRYVLGLLGPATRKNSWQLAEASGEHTPWAMQRLLNRARWDADQVRDQVRDVLVQRLASSGAVLVLHQSTMVKKGQDSVAVSRQYSDSTGRLENCQVGVFATYRSALGQAPVDRELYLPRSWTQDAQRCDAASVPSEQRTERDVAELGRVMIERTIAAGPVEWVRAGVAFGRSPRLRQWLDTRRVGYVMDVPPTLVAITRTGQQVPVGALPTAVAGLTWHRDGTGTEWACVPVRLRPSGPTVTRPAAGYAHTVLLRRQPGARQPVHSHVCHGPADTRLARLVGLVGAERSAKRCLRSASDRVGIDRYEVRTWPAWYRHVTLALLAFACLETPCVWAPS